MIWLVGAGVVALVLTGAGLRVVLWSFEEVARVGA